MLNKIKNNSWATSLVVTIVAIYGAFLGYTTAASYRAGYLSYFGVSIDMVPFWPKISDFMIAPVIAIIYIVIMTVVFFGAVMLGNYLAHKTVRFLERKKKEEEKSPMFDKVTQFTTVGLVGIYFIIMSLALPYFIMQGMGENFAKTTKDFTQLTGRETTTILIYQHEGTGIVKGYDPETKEFLDDYEVINLTGQKFNQVTLERPEAD